MNARPTLATPQRAKLRADDFWLLAKAGAFDGYARSELIEGEIWVMNAIHSWHAKTMAELGFALRSALNAIGSPLRLFMPVSVAMSDDSVPEPDLAIGEDHDDGPLPLAKVRLAVEVSDTTLGIDLGRKAALYARHDVPEYWVVARDRAQIVQHWEPGPDGYAKLREVKLGEGLGSVTIAGLLVETNGIA